MNANEKAEVEAGAVKNTSQSNPQPSHSEETVNLSIKVTRRQRLHWLLEAKKQGSSLTESIVDALSSRFGNPTK